MLLRLFHRSTVAAALGAACAASAGAGDRQLTIPHVEHATKRLITIDDVAALRDIDSLSLSPDRSHFAAFVRQGDPTQNQYRTGWFAGRADAPGPLVFLGWGGELLPVVRPNLRLVGDVSGGVSRWSPDGNWIAYTLRNDGQVQLWRSRIADGRQEQLTHNASDVNEFAWSLDGQALYFTVGTPRAALNAQAERRERMGYRYDEDLLVFTDLLKDSVGRELETDETLWLVDLRTGQERIAKASEHEVWRKIRTQDAEENPSRSTPVQHRSGAAAWLEYPVPGGRVSRVFAATPAGRSSSTRCRAEECSGLIKRIWWTEDTGEVLIWRGESVNFRTQGFYSWSPSSGRISTLFRAADEDLRLCERIDSLRLLCARETPNQPAHLALIDIAKARISLLSDVNPEFRNIRLGKVERFEWDTPKFSWNEPGGALEGLYASRAYGYILYPPDFDPAKKYPVFIDPYIAHGFNRHGAEHPLHVYAANGIIVLDLAFPVPSDVLAKLPGTGMRKLYSAELGFPHLTMLMESTLRGLDEASARGFIRSDKVGIGGVSHGTFVPLYMLQKHDRISAISISSTTWGPHEYYWATRLGRRYLTGGDTTGAYVDWRPKPEGAGRAFWSLFDIADHVDAVEAPVLMHIPDEEIYGLLRLIRHMDDARKPYETYVFRNETHVKWQPAHLYAIMNRNLDWFRYWLKDYEDPDASKAEQYKRWRILRAEGGAE